MNLERVFVALPSTRQLQYFVRIAELGSYRRAADSFGMSQPPLTQQMQALEHRLGVALFDRSTRRVALTSAGEALLSEARRMISSLEGCCSELSALDRGTSGRIRIGMTDDFLAATILTKLLNVVAMQRAIKFEMEIGISTELLAKLETNALDLILASPMPTEAARIEQWRLAATQIILLIPATHRLAANSEVSISQLSNEPMIMMPESSTSPFARRCRDLIDAVHPPPKIIHSSTSTAIGIRMVAENIGLCLATKGSISYLPKNVIQVKINCGNAVLQHAMFCRKGPRGAALRLVIAEMLKL